MSTPGWYPDPSGAPGRFRYWDGRAWSQQTTDRPGGSPTGSQPPRRRRTLPLIIGAIALALVIGLVVVFVFRQLDPASRPITNDPVPTSSESGWDDSSPTATPSPSKTPSPTPSPSASESTRPLTECPLGEPHARADHPADGRVYGGGLSFPRLAGWEDDVQTSGVSWAYDVGSQSKRLEPRWFSLVAVGELRRSDGFTSPRQAAESVVQCVASSSFYSHFESATEHKAEAATIDGHAAWWIRTDIRIDDPDVEADGDTVDVIVVDTGNPETFGMFLGGVTIGDRDLLATLDSTVTGLRVG